MTRSKTSQFLGQGWPLPIAPGASGGRIPYLRGADKVRQSIGIILSTEPGERVMRPDFGCGLRRHLMKPNTAATRALIQRDVQQALESWEPRIRLEAVRVEADDRDPALIMIHIDYVHQRDGSPANLVYPLYLD